MIAGTASHVHGFGVHVADVCGVQGAISEARRLRALCVAVDGAVSFCEERVEMGWVVHGDCRRLHPATVLSLREEGTVMLIHPFVNGLE